MILILILLLLIVSPNVKAQQTIIPPVVPLAVRSPYLSCWNNHSYNALIGQSWPTTFNDTQILGWSVLVRVDGLTYSFLGAVIPSIINGTVNDTNITVTPTQTIVAGRAGPMQVNLTFLNPIEPNDWVKQSIPFSYLAFTANALDGAHHSVQVYSDVSGEWNSGDRTKEILWSNSSTADIVFHSVTLQQPETFIEIIDQAEWGFLYYAMLAGNNVTTKIAVGDTARNYFGRNGTLDGQVDPHVRQISNQFAVFAIARDLGTIQSTQAPVVWAVGYTTDPAINYADLSGGLSTHRSPYYRINYTNDETLIVDFLKDFSNASSRARQLDNKILQDANSVSNDLGGLVSVAIAQVFGSMQLTVGYDAHENLNNSDVMIFMKNIGGSGTKRVNAVETLYAAFPALMYINPSFGGPLLEPLFQLQASPKYTIKYAATDLGSNYPNVAISNSNHTQGVEQTGNMLIMTYAYARASGDGSFISKYYKLLTSWADYLNNSALFNSDQTSADSLSVSNQTNLAIKGIIAIEAMSKMSAVLNHTGDEIKYSNAAAGLYAQWRRLAVSSQSDQHLLAVYEQSSGSWTLGYNMFADVWLGTNLVESSIYDGHSSFIENLVLTSDFSYFGMPSDSLSTDTSVAVSSWSLFVAAMTTNQGLSSQLISRVSNRASSTNTSGVFPVYYGSGDGTTVRGVASPAQGAVFAPLALKVPVQTINVNVAAPGGKSPSNRKRDIGAIVGGIIGGVAVIFAVIGGVVFVQRRRRRVRPKSILSSSSPTISWETGLHAIVTPFNPNSDFPEGAQDTGYPPEQQPLVYENPDAEMVASNRLSPSPPAILPFPQPAAPVPVGLSDKEMARLRAQNLNLGSRHLSPSPPAVLLPLPQPVAHVPVGLSGKEIARLRAQNLSSQQPQTRSTLNVSQPQAETSTSPANAATGPGEASSSYDTRRLHSEVESLRREMERLRAEGLAPPSYTEGGR